MRLIAKVIRISRAKFHYNRLTTGACPTVERSIWTDPLVRAMWIGPPLDALERNTQKKNKNGGLSPAIRLPTDKTNTHLLTSNKSNIFHIVYIYHCILITFSAILINKNNSAM